MPEIRTKSLPERSHARRRKKGKKGQEQGRIALGKITGDTTSFSN
jgi:hypothetical protein